MKTARSRKELVDEINITPLTDVFLVLLIIMMVVAPMVQNSDITPPRVDVTKQDLDPQVTVEIDTQGRYFVDGAETAESELYDALLAKVELATEGDLVVRADAATHSGQVLQVYNAAGDAGFKTLTVAVLSENSPASAPAAVNDAAPIEEPAP